MLHVKNNFILGKKKYSGKLWEKEKGKVPKAKENGASRVRNKLIAILRSLVGTKVYCAPLK